MLFGCDDWKNVNLGNDKHCVNRVQILSFFWSVFNSNAKKYGPQKTTDLDTSYAVNWR